jgi:hypothetical protein
MKLTSFFAFAIFLTWASCTTSDRNPSDGPQTMSGNKTHSDTSGVFSPDTSALMRLKTDADSVSNLNLEKTNAEPQRHDEQSVIKTHQQMTPAEYHQTAKFIWKTYVPKSGQAETVQGELLRAIEKLADEAQLNGNVNFHKNCHGILVSFLKKHLADRKTFDAATIKQIKQDLNTLLIKDEPYIEEDLYDRLRDRIVEWYLIHTTPIPHTKNPMLTC